MFFMARKYVIFLLIILVIAILSAGCSGSSTKDNSNSIGSSSTGSDSETGLQLVESHIETRNNGIKYVVGSVKNNGPHYKYVEISIWFYDSSGERVGRALHRINNLEYGETKKFEVIWDMSATSYKINDISAHL